MQATHSRPLDTTPRHKVRDLRTRPRRHRGKGGQDLTQNAIALSMLVVFSIGTLGGLAVLSVI